VAPAQPGRVAVPGGTRYLALGAPGFFLTLVGGVRADHVNRRRVIATFQSIQMLCPTVLVVLLLTATVRPWVVILLSLTVGITDALSMRAVVAVARKLAVLLHRLWVTAEVYGPLYGVESEAA